MAYCFTHYPTQLSLAVSPLGNTQARLTNLMVMRVATAEFITNTSAFFSQLFFQLSQTLAICPTFFKTLGHIPRLGHCAHHFALSVKHQGKTHFSIKLTAITAQRFSGHGFTAVLSDARCNGRIETTPMRPAQVFRNNNI